MFTENACYAWLYIYEESKTFDKLKRSFLSFKTPFGMKMNSNNQQIKLAIQIPREEFKMKYASLFLSDIGNVAKASS